MKAVLRYILIFSCFMLVYATYGEEAHKVFQKANEAYIKKDYATAIQLYETIVETGNVNADLYYNLGNAYLKNEQLAQSILYYERALRLNPTNKDIIHNIAFANQKIIDDMEVMPELIVLKWMHNFHSLFSSNTWAVIAFICCVAMFVVGGLMLVSRIHKRRIYLLFVSLIFFVFLAASITFSILQYQQFNRSNEAIITQISVVVKSMPDQSGTDLFTVHEGLKVKISDKVGKWVEVVFPNGNKGWIENSDLEII